MCEIVIKKPELYSELIKSIPEDEREIVNIINKQSAEALEERLFLAQLQQSKSTYLVCFDNGYNYGHVSAIDLYNFQKLKKQYNQIINDREEYLQELQKELEFSAIINPTEYANAYKIKLMETEPYLNEIIKAAQLFTMPFNREIEKIIDETTNTVVKMNSLTDFLKENYPDKTVKAIMKLEKIRMQRTRAANKGVQKLFVDVYNKTHNDSELKITDYGIIKVGK